MKIYHITYSPNIAYLHFWGCNFSCKACLCKKEIWDCHLPHVDIFKDVNNEGYLNSKASTETKAPDKFLSLSEVVKMLKELEAREVILMGMEPSINPELPELTKALHTNFHTRNILLTNGYELPSLEHVDEVVVSIKAFSNDLHKDYTGKDNEKVLENFRKIHQLGIKLYAESVLIPSYIDREEIGKISKFIASVDNNIPYRIDSYIPVAGNEWRRPTQLEMEEAYKQANKYLKQVDYLRGDKNLLTCEFKQIFP
ncbi:MAG: radical SAM protein [Candidatus Aenigmarchaeota archaeon]|nr:radical SAM protein [Candidatus Aenigmarchaeota archaeon]